MGHVIADIKVGLRIFQQWQMSFVKREENQAARLLAKFAVKNGVDKVWSESPDGETVLLEQFALAQ
jgi:hypothetical protein